MQTLLDKIISKISAWVLPDHMSVIPFSGYILEGMAVWSRLLTKREKEILYNNGVGFFEDLPNANP